MGWARPSGLPPAPMLIPLAADLPDDASCSEAFTRRLFARMHTNATNCPPPSSTSLRQLRRRGAAGTWSGSLDRDISCIHGRGCWGRAHSSPCQGCMEPSRPLTAPHTTVLRMHACQSGPCCRAESLAWRSMQLPRRLCVNLRCQPGKGCALPASVSSPLPPPILFSLSLLLKPP